MSTSKINNKGLGLGLSEAKMEVMFLLHHKALLECLIIVLILWCHHIVERVPHQGQVDDNKWREITQGLHQAADGYQKVAKYIQLIIQHFLKTRCQTLDSPLAWLRDPLLKRTFVSQGVNAKACQTNIWSNWIRLMEKAKLETKQWRLE